MTDDQLTERRVVPETRVVRRIRVDVVSGPDTGTVVEGGDARAIAIGSAPDNELVLSDPTVSRYHLELHRAEGGVGVADLGSLNGCFLGPVRVERAIVPPGTRLTIGGTELALLDGSLAERRPTGTPVLIPGIVGESEAMKRVAAQVERLAKAAASVLIWGETGTGKELFARAIHDLGSRREGPFIVVDCGSMPATLIASELFGHERGAFTGAEERRAGAFDRADGGTIVLDEIGELPLAVQPALLGVLERRRYRRLGSDREVSVDVRVISATHRDLRSEVNAGNFRADLYYRLAVARLVLPALRERPEDIPHLVAHFVREATGSSGQSPFGAQTLEALMAHPWSGNVRELRNVVESALAMGHVSLEEGPSPGSGGRGAAAAATVPAAGATDPSLPYKEARAQLLDRFEKGYLTRLIAECEGNASEAARRAKMDRPYLLSLLRRHGLR